MRRRRPARSAPGDVVPGRTLVTITDEWVAVPDPDRLVHVQFRRFAGCPICNMHLRSFVQRHDEIVAAGVLEVVLFHSPADELRTYDADLPMAVVADPGRRLYTEFGIEARPRALLDPRVVPVLLKDLWEIVRRRRSIPPPRPHGGLFGLPGDFLIAPDGRLLACKYGEHADDQWTVDQLLRLARTASTGQ